MLHKRSPPQMLPSDRVRQLWTEFELWHAAQRLAIEQRIVDAQRELDLKWRVSSSKTRMSRKDLDERKNVTRLEIERTFNGNSVRLEWQKRLDRAGLQSDDWNDMTEAEQRKVEIILGVDLDPSDLAGPVLQNQWSTRKGALFSPVVNNFVRPDSSLDSYAVVDPHSFSTERGDENEDEPWTEVQVYKTTRRSDDEISLDASTSSSLGGFDSVDGGAIWSSGVSRSSTQTSQTSSPEHIPSKFLASDVNQQSLLSAAKLLSNASEPHDALSRNSTDTGRWPQADVYQDDSSCSSLSASCSLEPPLTMNDMPSNSSSKSRTRYVGPELLTDATEAVDEEADFEEFKIETRVQKIREFHEEAAAADIQFMKDVAEARRSKAFTREQEMKRVEEHEKKMLDLRKRKEDDRKRIVEAERQKRQAELRQRTQVPPAQATQQPESRPVVPSITVPEDIAKVVGDAGSAASETPTIRRNKSQRGALQMDWSSGGDTPTPTGPSAWGNKNSSQTMPSTPADVFADVPPLRRLSSQPLTTLASSSTQAVVENPSSVTSPSQNPLPSVTGQSPTVNSKAAVSNAVEPPKSSPSKAKNEKAKAVQQDPAVATSKTTLDKMSKAPTSSNIPVAKAEPIVPSSSSSSSSSSPSSAPVAFSSVSSSLNPAKPKTETVVASTKSSSSPVRPKVMQAQSTSAIPSIASSSTKSRPLEPIPQTSTASSSSKSRTSELPASSIPAISTASTSAKARAMEPNPTSASTSSTRPNMNTSTLQTTSASMASSTASNSTSAWTSWAPTTSSSLSQSQQVPEDRRVWVPPPSAAATENNKRPPPSRKTTDPPQITKSASNPIPANSHPQPTKPQPIPVEVKRARRLSEPSSPSPKSFEFPITGHGAAGSGTAKVADKRSERPAADGPSGILKKSGTGTVLVPKSGKGASQKKKVTIEEVDDDETVEVPEHLPTDSRYIMEPVQPKPMVPPAMFTQIFEYDAEKEKEQKEQKVKVKAKETTGPEISKAPVPDVPPPKSHGNSSANVNGGRGNANTTAPDVVSSKPTKPKQVRWSSDSQKPRDTEPDSFLSMLDSLEATLHGSDHLKQEEAHQQADKLSRLLSEATERPRRVERDGNGLGGRPGPGPNPVYAPRGGSGVTSVW